MKGADPAKDDAGLQPPGAEASAKQGEPAPAVPEKAAVPAKEEKKTTEAPPRPKPSAALPSEPAPPASPAAIKGEAAAPDPPVREEGPQTPMPSVTGPKPEAAAEEPPAVPAEPPGEPENTPAAVAGGDAPSTETGTLAGGPTQGNDEPSGSNGPEEAVAEEETGEIAPATVPKSTAPQENLADIHPMSCSDASLGFDDYILAVAGNYEKQKIAYNSIPLSDCSGMFHRVVLAVKDFCPAYRYPEAVANIATQ